MMYPQYMPYQMPQYYAPMMPFPQPMMYPQQPMMMPAQQPAAAVPASDRGGNVPVPPTKLPDPESTGAVMPQPAAVVTETAPVEGGAEKPKEEKKPADPNPSNKAADIIKSFAKPRINRST